MDSYVFLSCTGPVALIALTFVFTNTHTHSQGIIIIIIIIVNPDIIHTSRLLLETVNEIQPFCKSLNTAPVFSPSSPFIATLHK